MADSAVADSAVADSAVADSAVADTSPPEPGFLFTPLGPANQVAMIDLATETVVDTFEVGENPHGMAVSPDGTMLYTARMIPEPDVNWVAVTNVETKERVADIAVSKISHHLAAAADGRQTMSLST